MSYIDIAIIGVVVLGALIGLWKGFFKTLISFFGGLVSFLVAFFLTKVIAEALLDVGAIRNFVVGSGSGWSLYSWIHGKLPPLDELSGILATILKPILSVAESAGGDITVNVALLLANGIFNILVCIALFIAIRVVLLLFTMFANAMTKDKLVGALNRLLGLVFGAVKGLGIVAVVMVIMTFIMGLGFMAPVRAQMDKSVIGAPVYTQVCKVTDKFLSGDGNMLDKLLNLLHKGEKPSDEEPGAYANVAGEYSTTTEVDGVTTTYVFRLAADGTFTRDIGGGPQRTGTFAIENGTLTLTYAAEEGKDPDVDVAEMGDGWFYIAEWKMSFALPGVTPPDRGEPAVRIEGTYVYADGDTVYTLTLEDSGQLTLSVSINGGTPETSTGTYNFNAETNRITIHDADEEEAVYADGKITWDGREYVKQD